MVLKLELMSCSERSEMLNLFSLSQEDWESTWLIYKHLQGEKTQDPAALFNQAEKCIKEPPSESWTQTNSNCK